MNIDMRIPSNGELLEEMTSIDLFDKKKCLSVRDRVFSFETASAQNDVLPNIVEIENPQASVQAVAVVSQAVFETNPRILALIEMGIAEEQICKTREEALFKITEAFNRSNLNCKYVWPRATDANSYGFYHISDFLNGVPKSASLQQLRENF